MLWVVLEREPAEAATAAIEAGAEALVVPEGSADAVRALARVRVVERRGSGELVEAGKVIGHVMAIASVADVRSATRAIAAGEVVVLVTRDWTVIPLEDLVAARRGEALPGRLLAQVADAKEAGVALGALEHGVDGVAVVAPPDGAAVKALLAEVRGIAASQARLELTVGKVRRIEPLGLGDRACVDTCDLLELGEGLLIGSSSKGMVLVHGETVENPYAAVRPFRVNAGAVHSYVLVPGGRTRYLSEARAGTLVMVVGRDGAGRASHVGRLKIERRPLVLVEVEADGHVFNAILQNAETVRLVTPGGHASVRELKAGDEVLVHLPAGPAAGPAAGKGEGAHGRGGRGGKDGKGGGGAKGPVGRHFGRAVPERVVEG